MVGGAHSIPVGWMFRRLVNYEGTLRRESNPLLTLSQKRQGGKILQAKLHAFRFTLMDSGDPVLTTAACIRSMCIVSSAAANFGVLLMQNQHDVVLGCESAEEVGS